MQAGPPFIKRYLLLVVMVMTNLGMVLTLCGCGPNAVNVVNPDAEAFQQLLSAELAADARRPAHGMAAYVSGRSSGKGGRLDDAKLPEPYNVEVGASIRPAKYHLGYAAQRLIREYYAATHPRYRMLETNELAEVVKVDERYALIKTLATNERAHQFVSISR